MIIIDVLNVIGENDDMRQNGRRHLRRRQQKLYRIVIGVLVVVLVAAISIVSVHIVKTNAEIKAEEEARQQLELEQQEAEEAAEENVDSEPVISDALQAELDAENDSVHLGIDVSRYQGTINWSKVKDAGIDFAIVRIGYRDEETGQIVEDSNARYNLQEATAAGIQAGAYFFSTAISEDEAVEEANFTIDILQGYAITYPVAFNCEGFQNSDSRMASLSITDRTNIACKFLDTVREAGYIPMFYAARNELQDSAAWDTDIIENNYKVWVAQYVSDTADIDTPDYDGSYGMWQYSASATVDGISKQVDVDKAYFGYDNTASPKGEAATGATADVEALMNFKEVNETVTAKDSTNLRNIPSQGTDSSVLYTLKNGDTATRTGISDSGWSRLSYNGNTCYAVSNYLTTDLTVKETVAQETTDTSQTDVTDVPTGTAIKTQFTACDDLVTAKSMTNLRTLPSVTNSDSQVVKTLYYGEVVHRTGYNADYGWSRVEYEGQTLYCVSSFLTAAPQ